MVPWRYLDGAIRSEALVRETEMKKALAIFAAVSLAAVAVDASAATPAAQSKKADKPTKKSKARKPKKFKPFGVELGQIKTRKDRFIASGEMIRIRSHLNQLQGV